jgi:hypothetical protein
MPDYLLAYVPVLLLAFVLVAPRRHGRPVSYLARVLAVIVAVGGSIVVTLGLLWNHLLSQ